MFYTKKLFLPQKKHHKFAGRLIFIWERGTFFPVVARTWLEEVEFFGGAQNFVNGLFVALVKTVLFATLDRFFVSELRSLS